MNKREHALHVARNFKEALLQRKVPVRQVFLFGSAATGAMDAHSDIDIAVVCSPFRRTKHEEGAEMRKLTWDIEPRIEVICLHPEDMENRYSTIVQEVKKYGIAV